MLTAIFYMGTIGFGVLCLWEGHYLLALQMMLFGTILAKAHNAEIYAEQAKENTEKILLKLEGDNSLGDRTDKLTRLVETLQHSIRIRS